jgi:hypothetical protein
MAISSTLKALDLKFIDLYEFAQLFFKAYGTNIFKPLNFIIPVTDYGFLLKEIFGERGDLNEIVYHADQEFFEYMRIEVLHINGFFTIDGYYRSLDDIEDITTLL